MNIFEPHFKFKLRKYWLDRFPAKPYIPDGYPQNQTVIVNGNVTFECPVLEDMGTHITWAKHAIRIDDSTDSNSTAYLKSVPLEVFFCCIFQMEVMGFHVDIIKNVVSTIS